MWAPRPVLNTSNNANPSVVVNRGQAGCSSAFNRSSLSASAVPQLPRGVEFHIASAHSPGGSSGKTIHAEQADVDGLVYASRLTGEDIYAIYDRSVVKLKAGEVGRLEEHVDLPGVLARHGIGLLV